MGCGREGHDRADKQGEEEGGLGGRARSGGEEGGVGEAGEPRRSSKACQSYVLRQSLDGAVIGIGLGIRWSLDWIATRASIGMGKSRG